MMALLVRLLNDSLNETTYVVVGPWVIRDAVFLYVVIRRCRSGKHSHPFGL
jgi:hypothetical protein